jgi:hypothetical protein
MEDFASFEQYLDALVNHERTTLGSPQQSRKPLGKSEIDSLDDDILDLLGDVDTERPNSSGMDNRYRDSLNPNRSWSPRSGGSGSTPVKDPGMGWDADVPRRRQDEAYSSRGSTNGGGSSGGESSDYDDLDSFLNSLEVSNVLSSTKSKLKKDEAEEATDSPSPSKEERFVAAAAYSNTKQKEFESLSPSSGVRDESAFADMTVKDLKDKLRERGLPLSGSKAELLNRLRGR